MPFDQALAFVRGVGLRNRGKWNEWWRDCPTRPSNLPLRPENVYKHDGWRGYSHWLGLISRSQSTPHAPSAASSASTDKPTSTPACYNSDLGMTPDASSDSEANDDDLPLTALCDAGKLQPLVLASADDDGDGYMYNACSAQDCQGLAGTLVICDGCQEEYVRTLPFPLS